MTCTHRHTVTHYATWIETCCDCGAWRWDECDDMPLGVWRVKGGTALLVAVPPDIGADVPGGGAV